MANENSKKYTNLEVVNAVKTDGKPFKYAAIRGFATNVETRTLPLRHGETEAQSVTNFSIPVENRNKALNAHLGLKLPVGEDQVTWLRVSMWGATGQRLAKFIGNKKSRLIDVFGELTSRPYKAKDGREAHSIELKAYNFWGVPTGASKDTSQQQEKPQPQPQPQNRSAAPSSEYPMDENGFCDLPDDDDDGEVPF